MPFRCRAPDNVRVLRPIASPTTDRRFLTRDGLTLRAGQAPRRYVGGARIVLMQGRE
jgi:hypothetical protein